MLEVEKASRQQNLASIVEMATEQNTCVREKCEELYEKLMNAREEARVAHEQLTSNNPEEKSVFMSKLLSEVEDVILEVQDSKVVTESIASILDEVPQIFSALFETFIDFKTLMYQSNLQQKSIISNHEKLNSFLMQKVSDLENEKCHLNGQSVDLQNQIEELKLQTQTSEQSLRTLLEEQEEYLSYIQNLEREISSYSSCSLAKEKEALRKDLEKTKAKLKDTEFKLRNAMQDKTRLEGEKAFAEREVKRLHGQKSLLERDINRRESFAGRRHDSVPDKNPKIFDPKKLQGLTGSFDQTLQEEYMKMEVNGFEMETKIASLEEELSSARQEKEEILSRSEDLASELEALSEKFNTSDSELNLLQEEVSALKQRLEISKLEQQQMESSIKLLEEEKEELAMQLSNSLLEMEEEKAVWSAKERASIEAIEEKARLHDMEIASLSKQLSEVRNELDSRRQECEMLRERLTCLEEDKGKEKSSMDKFLETNQEEVDMLKKDLSSLKKEREDLLIQIRELQTRPDISNDFQSLENQLVNMTEERDKLATQIQKQQTHAVEVEFLNKRCNDMLTEANLQVEELTRRISSMEVKMHQDQMNSNKDMTKHRMRLRWTQAKLDAFRDRHRKMVKESDQMNKNYEAAAGQLKEKLAKKALEVLNLKKQLAAKGQ